MMTVLLVASSNTLTSAAYYKLLLNAAVYAVQLTALSCMRLLYDACIVTV